MTKTADVKDMAANLADWLKEVAAGHEVVITQHAKPLAKLVAAEPTAGPAAMSAAAQRAEALTVWIKANARPGAVLDSTPISGAELAEEMFDRS